ncbi:MAG: hypothetical protein P4M09_16935 [Devosia sp.]|nr:hypothetical protein [Devosia sp.]
MKVYLPGTGAKNSRSHMLSVAPAADTRGEVPVDWVTADNEPVQFRIEFAYGAAEVDDRLGKYLIERGICRKTALVLPRAA